MVTFTVHVDIGSVARRLSRTWQHEATDEDAKAYLLALGLTPTPVGWNGTVESVSSLYDDEYHLLPNSHQKPVAASHTEA